MKISFYKISLVFLIASIAIYTLWVKQVDLFHDPMGLEKSYPYMFSFYFCFFVSILTGVTGLIRFVISKKNEKNT